MNYPRSSTIRKHRARDKKGIRKLTFVVMFHITKLIREALASQPALSLAAASRGAGKSDGYVKALRAGRIKDPGVKTLWSLAKFLNISTSDLVLAIEADLGSGVHEEEMLSNEELRLVQAFRRLERDQKSNTFRAIDQAAKSAGAGPKGRRGTS